MSGERRSPPDPDEGGRTAPHDVVGASIEAMGRDIEAATSELDSLIEAARERERRLSRAPAPSPPREDGGA